MDLTIVGVGASAGGLEAFKTFFSAMPSDSGMAFVVVLHLPEGRRSLLPDILSRWTDMDVHEMDGVHDVLPNTIYVPPPHAVLVLRDGRLHVTPPPVDSKREFRPIDGFFDTLAASQQERAVGIILSGTGSDGALGFKAIRACGGLTIAQMIDSQGAGQTGYDGMPSAAIATGAVDLVATVEDIPGHLLRLVSRVSPDGDGEAERQETEAQRLSICALLRARMGHDFSNYKDKTFMRRVGRRMNVNAVDSMDDYIGLLEADPNEPMLLFRDLLIRVTSFFRDNAAFESIERVVVPRIFEGRHADDTVRIWVPGCSTGEEAYSLAILMREHMDSMRGPPRVQIFATDIDEPAIGTARLGRYPAVLVDGISDSRRARFFSKSDSGYVVTKEIRELCTFSAHSLVRDPPFSRLDLVSCRNLLIYLDSDLQAKVIPAFHYALSPDGVLILGVSEGTSRHDDLFEPLDKSARIFLRRNVRSPPMNLNARDVRRLAHPERSEHTAKPSAPAVSRAASPTMREPPKQQSMRTWRRMALGAEGALGSLLGVRASRARPSERLIQELASTRDELQSLSEEYETAVEELRSANEELSSVNEELQSANEELETSKEEIQSVNEELHTVNQQLQEKVDELDRVNSDLKNLFDSTQIATVFLDRHMVVRGFTPAISGIYNLIPSDVGRPLTDIVSHVPYDGMRADIADVLEKLHPLERRVSSTDGSAHYIMRILPYRASDSAVSGTLITFLDVSSVVRAEQHQRLLVDELNHRVKNMLTVVISLATQTIRRSDTLDVFKEAFLGRVHALSASYTLLSRENWVSISLRDVIEEEVKPFKVRDGKNIELAGAEIQLVPAAALALGMALHELTTNAVKYGALSHPEGTVSIDWRIEQSDAQTDATLLLDWIEHGGPPVSEPEHTGFGLMLIQRGLFHELGGGATLAFRPDGLQAKLRTSVARAVSRPLEGVGA